MTKHSGLTAGDVRTPQVRYRRALGGTRAPSGQSDRSSAPRSSPRLVLQLWLFATPVAYPDTLVRGGRRSALRAGCDRAAVLRLERVRIDRAPVRGRDLMADNAIEVDELGNGYLLGEDTVSRRPCGIPTRLVSSGSIDRGCRGPVCGQCATFPRRRRCCWRKLHVSPAVPGCASASRSTRSKRSAPRRWSDRCKA